MMHTPVYKKLSRTYQPHCILIKGIGEIALCAVPFYQGCINSSQGLNDNRDSTGTSFVKMHICFSTEALLG